jgi:hypothetical protein
MNSWNRRPVPNLEARPQNAKTFYVALLLPSKLTRALEVSLKGRAVHMSIRSLIMRLTSTSGYLACRALTIQESFQSNVERSTIYCYRQSGLPEYS